MRMFSKIFLGRTTPGSCQKCCSWTMPNTNSPRHAFFWRIKPRWGRNKVLMQISKKISKKKTSNMSERCDTSIVRKIYVASWHNILMFTVDCNLNVKTNTEFASIRKMFSLISISEIEINVWNIHIYLSAMRFIKNHNLSER